MKKLLVSAIVLCLFSCNNKDTKKTEAATVSNSDLVQQNLKGKVQELDELTVNMDSSGKAKSDSAVEVSVFDEKGYQVKYFTKDSSGKTVSEQTFTRNPDGTFAEVIRMKNGKQISRLTTEVKDGKYTGGKNYDSTGKQDSYYTDLKTNDYGIVYSGKQHFMNDKIKSTFDMKYDGPNFIGGTATDSTGKTSYTGTVKLNDKGDPIEEKSTTLEKDSSKTELVTYKYDATDDKGNWTQRTTYDDKGKVKNQVKRTITYFKE